MKIRFMGTAAAEAIPALFCVCPVCTAARKAGGREIRTRSGALIDEGLKLDFGPDSYAQAIMQGVDYAQLHTVLISHTHEDHFIASEIANREAGYSYLPEGTEPLAVVGNSTLGEMLKRSTGPDIAWLPIRPFETIVQRGYSITALEAVHCLGRGAWPVRVDGELRTRTEQAQFYLIEREGKRILYAHDTDLFPEEDYAFLAGKHLDLVSLDCTKGILEPAYRGHMSASQCLAVKDRLTAIGATDASTVFVASHFSHNGAAPYDVLSAALPGFTVAYDGLVIEV